MQIVVTFDYIYLKDKRLKSFTLILLFINLIGFSQANHADSVDNLADKLSQVIGCAPENGIDYIKLALEKINKDSLFIPCRSGISHKLNKTAREILKREYNLINRSPAEGCVIPASIWCFEKLMVKAIECKHGVGFLDSIAKTSSRLKDIGKGYKPPQFKNSSINVYEHITDFGYTPANYMKEHYNDYVQFKIGIDGQIYNIQYFKSYTHYYEENYDINPQLKKALTTNFLWKPAYLKGKPIIEIYELSLAEWKFN